MPNRLLRPLIAAARATRRRIVSESGPQGWTGHFSSIEEAAKAPLVRKYEQVAQQEEYIRERLAPNGSQRKLDTKHLGMLAGIEHCLARNSNRTFSLVDFGGGLGLHYHRLRPLLPSERHLLWKVVELPSVADAGNAMKNVAELQYFNELPAAADSCGGRVDLILASGVLQAVDEPRALIRTFAKLADFVLLISLPFTDSESDFVAVNHDHSPPFPLWFFGSAGFRDHLRAAGLKEELEWQNTDTFWLVNGRRTQPACSLLLSSGHSPQP